MASKNTTSEKEIERYLVKRVGKAGGWAFKLLSDYVKGLPDRICIFPGGRIAFVEVKSTGKLLSPVQKLIAAKLEKLGCDVRKIDDLKGVEKLINDYKN